MSPTAPDGTAASPSAVSTIRHSLFHNLILWTINLSIAVFLVAGVAAVYWYGWRTLPQTSGTISAPISAKATITRDKRGIPHIVAATWEDAIFLQGYVTAQDRMWQMDALRRIPGGALAEVLGRGAMDSILESDRDARRWRLSRIAEAQERTLQPEARAVMAAYARGVNYWRETHSRLLPPEFVLLNYDPRPWRIQDSLLVALEMGRSLTNTWREKMNKLQMLNGGDAAMVNFLYPRRTGGEIQPGSNAWVISGAHSSTGKPILANDPHLEWTVPSAWHLVHLRAADLDVTGASLPGVPAVILGHNRRIAWGVTNLGFEVQDLYREQIDLRTGRYLFKGRPEQAVLERDVIAVKGSPAIRVDTWVTRHGPIFLNENNRIYSMRWIAAGNERLDFPFLAIDRANNWDQFKTALARFAWPAQNFVYADVDGNIGYHATGRLPVRPANCVPDVPLDGASGQCEWQDFIPFEKLPQAFNPPSGMIVTANQNPFPADSPWAIDGRFAPKYRAQEIRALLQSRAQWSPPDMLTIQTNVYSAFAHFFAGQLVAAWDKHASGSAQMRNAIDLLRLWNGQMEIGDSAAMLVMLTYDDFRNAVAERASKGHSPVFESSFLAPEIIEKLLRLRPSEWFADYDALLLKSLSNAIERGARLQGSKLSRWNYGKYNQLKVENPVLGRLPLLGKYFDLGPALMSGSPTTIKQISRRVGPSLRIIVDLGELDRSLENTTMGESAHPLSSHYRDQWDAYYNGRSFPMEFDKVEAKQTLTVNPE